MLRNRGVTTCGVTMWRKRVQKNRRAPPSAAVGSGEVALARVLGQLRDDGARRFFCISNLNPNPRLVREGRF